MKNWEIIKTEFKALTEEMEKVSKGNKSAGTRARKHIKGIMDAGKGLRKEIQENKKA